jgi:hypothetical protein
MSKLTPEEAAHARSVGDPPEAVQLAPIPPAAPGPRVLIGSVVRKPPQVVAAFLETLRWQRFRRPTQVDYAFITDFAPGEAGAAESTALLKAATPNVLERGNAGGDYAEGGATHTWTASAMQRCGALKNELMQRCLDGGFDALWLVDADVLCDPYTLQSLVDCEAPIVAGVYWTQWVRPEPADPRWSQQVIHAAPQVWLRHPYRLDGHGYSEAEFRSLLVNRQLVKVGGLGACTLFHRTALAKGINFAPVPEGLPPGPMSDGEDRHLCERARRLHLPLLADAWPDIFHAYHAAEYADIPAALARLNRPSPETAPATGDLVSVKVEVNEPVPNPTNPRLLQYVAPQWVRGRLGSTKMLPEMEEAVASMTVGDRRVVHVHFPAHYDYAPLRGQSRVMTLTLLDAKPFGLAPIIEREVLRGTASGALKDVTELTAHQIDRLVSVG